MLDLTQQYNIDKYCKTGAHEEMDAKEIYNKHQNSLELMEQLQEQQKQRVDNTTIIKRRDSIREYDTAMKLTDEQFKEAWRLRKEERLTYKEIGEIFGINNRTIYYNMKYKNKRLINQIENNKVSAGALPVQHIDKISEIIKLLDQGKTPIEIAIAIPGVTPEEVRKGIKRYEDFQRIPKLKYKKK